MALEEEKQLAGEAAAQLVEAGMRVGLGTGTTVTYLLAALAEQSVDAIYVATSPQTERAARALGLVLEPFDHVGQLDLAIDGADQISADGWLIKAIGRASVR